MRVIRWIEEREERLADRWSREVAFRISDADAGLREILSHFHRSLVAFLPACMGPARDEVEASWLQATELYGSLALHRGLAAGEVVEEVQLLRDCLLRLLLEDPPAPGLDPALGRDILLLNRVVDTAVTQASVGYADALFFSLVQGSGVQEAATPEQLREIRRQLDLLRGEMEAHRTGKRA